MFRTSSKTEESATAAAAAAAAAKEAAIAAAAVAAFKPRNLMWPDLDVAFPSPPKPAAAATGADSNSDNKNAAVDPALVASIATSPSPILADNVSGLQETRVAGFFFPMNNDDVAEVLRRARAAGKKVCARGTAHCMSKHNLAEDALLLDFKHMKQIKVDAKNKRVTCQPGATWADLIVALNPYGCSPRTMQSYSSFAVGGTCAVNAHGITTDFGVAESVTSIDVFTHDGTLVTCDAEAPAGTLEHTLFRHVLGGYGMFGIMVSLTMRTTQNDSLLAESFSCEIKDFPHMYERFLEESQKEVVTGQTVKGSDVETGTLDESAVSVKLCRLNIVTCNTVQVFLFRKRGHAGTIGRLSDDPNSSSPREMSTFTRLLYKWILPALKDVRYQIEENSGAALDWSASASKNELMFETAEPLARLSEPLFLADDTFILQEFFVDPCADGGGFARWIDAVRPIYADVAQNEMPSPQVRVQLLNTTIRYVKKDRISALPYARAEKGVYAFVLYYRLLRTKESVEYLRQINQRFITATLALPGENTFYLPYLHQYDCAQLLKAYPMLPDFVKTKEKLDPNGLFDSEWFREYGLQFASESYKKNFVRSSDNNNNNNNNNNKGSTTYIHNSVVHNDNNGAKNNKKSDDEIVPQVSERRENSLRTLMKSSTLRTAFCGEFLVNVFNIIPTSVVEQALSRCCWDPSNKTDLDIYVALKAMMDKTSTAPIAQAKKGWAQLTQLSGQKRELADETVRIMTRLGKLGKIHDYLSMGDHGKLVMSLRRDLRVDGKVRVIHDEPEPEDSVLVAVETASATKLGEFTLVDWNKQGGRLSMVESDSQDLVTLNQGLHHMPQGTLPTLLREIERVLRPGGIFITREHDCREDGVCPVAMADAAHAVFNAITGVAPETERKEIRAFRPLAEWRRIISSVTNLQDSMCVEVQRGDPTMDFMIAFYKAPLHPYAAAAAGPYSAAAKSETERLAAIFAGKASLLRGAGAVPMPQLPFHATVEKLPETLMAMARAILGSVAPLVEGLGDQLAAIAAPTDYAPVVKGLLRQYTQPFAHAAQSILRQTQHTKPRQLQIEYFPVELLYAFLALQAQVQKGKASPQVAFLVTTIKNIIGALLGTDQTAAQQAEQREKELQASAAISLAQAQAESTGTAAAGSGSGMISQSSLVFEGDVNEPISMHHGEIVLELRALLTAMPQIVDGDTLLDLGFPEPVVDAMASMMPPTLITRRADGTVAVDEGLLQAAAVAVEGRLDSECWYEARRHMKAISATKPRLTFDILMGRDQASVEKAVANKESRKALSPWFRLMMTLLGSPKVQLTYAVTMAARFYGMPELGQLHTTAQEMRAQRRMRHSNAQSEAKEARIDMASHLAPEHVADMESALALLETPLRTITMTGGDIKNLYGVAEVHSATYSGKDVTKTVKEALLRPCPASYAKEAAASAGPAAPAMKMILLEGGTSKLDSVFSFGFTALSPLFYGSRTISIVYKSGARVPSENLKHASTLVKRVLTCSRSPEVRQMGLASAGNGGQMVLNIMKVCEYLQVEIMKDFSTMLDVSPWYRYPLMDVLGMYWRVMGDLTAHNIKHFGLKDSLMSNGMATAAVPGVVMLWFFGQLKLLQLPVKATFGDQYDDSGLVAKLLVHVNTAGMTVGAAPAMSSDSKGSGAAISWPSSIATHPKVAVKTLFNSGSLLVQLTLPVFSDFSNMVQDLARHNFSNEGGSVRRATIMDIDGNAGECTIKLRTSINATGHAPSTEEVLRARGFPSVKLLTEYRSTAAGSGTTQGRPLATVYNFSALLVPVSQLLEIIRICDTEGITVVQCFDFYA